MIDPFRVKRVLAVLLMAAAAGLLCPSDCHAQRREKTGPYIEYVFPAGAQRGATLEATIGGQKLQGASAVRVNGKGVTGSVTQPVDAKPVDGKPVVAKPVDGKTVNVTITVAPDAELGEREIRLITPSGVSNRFRFIVGQFPEVKEVEPNSEKTQAQPLDALPVVVNGQIMQGDRDYYRLSAKAGQTLVFRAEARRLLPFIADAVPGWNDVLLTLYDAAGHEITSLDDYHLKPDPVLIYQVPKDGDYLIEVRDIIFRGRADFIYRLSIGTLPHISHIYPLGGKRGTTVKVELSGIHLPGQSLDLAIPNDSPARRSIQVTQNGIVSNDVPFAVGDVAEIEEKEPNDKFAEANRVEVPATINGRIQRVDDEDYYVFAAKAKQQLILEVCARRLDSPLDSILTLFNAKEQEVMENDDTVDAGEGLVTHHADARLVYTVPADGDYTVRLRDVQGKGGQEYAYRLMIAPVKPDFYLHISPDNPQMGQGDTALISVTAVRKDGFNGEIKLAAQDLPKGFTAGEAVIAAGQPLAYMTISSPLDAPMEFFSPTIAGTATVGEETVTRKALPAEEQMQSFSFRHTVPTQELLLSVMETPPFVLSVKLPPEQKVVEVAQGGETQVVIKATRRPEPAPEPKPDAKPDAKPEAKPAPKDPNKDRIVLAVANPPPLPPGISLKPAYITADADEVAITISAAASARPDVVQQLILSGTQYGGKQPVVRMVPAIPIRVRAGPPPAEK